MNMTARTRESRFSDCWMHRLNLLADDVREPVEVAYRDLRIDSIDALMSRSQNPGIPTWSRL